VKAELNLQRPW